MFKSRSNPKSKYRKHIDVSIDPETLRMLDRVAGKGKRGRFIDQAVRYFVTTKAQANLKAQLEEGYRVRSRHDLEVAEEWFNIDEEAWQKHGL